MQMARLIAIPLFLVAIAMGLGDDWSFFLSLHTLIMVVGFTVFMGVTAFGWRDFLFGVRALGVPYRRELPSWVTLRHTRIVREMRRHFLLSGAIGTAIGLVRTLASLSSLSCFGKNLAVSFLSAFYGLLFALLLCQPALTRLSRDLSSTPGEAHPPPPDVVPQAEPLLALRAGGLRFWGMGGVVVLLVFSGWYLIKGGDEPPLPKASGVLVTMAPIATNLLGEGEDGRRLLRVTIVLHVNDGGEEEATNRMVQLRDITISLLSGKTVAGIKGADGKFRLREELLARLNGIMATEKIRSLYFEEFMIDFGWSAP